MKLIKAIALATILAAGSAQAVAAQTSGTGRLVEHEVTSPPIGHVQFCRMFADDCRLSGKGIATVELTARAWADLVEVNDAVNEQVSPITDLELYGVAEHWTYPANQGDCEDYVLLKRKRLIERGWPANSVLITVVRDQYGDGHAVLTVVTSAGDLVLDNQDAEIRFWSETPYRYLKRQSHRDATRWVSLQDDRRLTPPLVAATPR
ncbi:transglutaminase-like cysteine peptidase [Lutibaculum baratangense]|uniref:Transglutaminase-like cysteine peptidase, BTLCP n=1 Tax=Lutibaculum baratangense AMV1 TaxID=631454 RepID=V4TGA6_9HYPH|nr:transglutaminase-like cysteine peptidase [Lutibaculum baratangense]ESR25153.1 transglutaminase-like cysteine peptidase, BTLCP [Lutibaculum baratangense AMV1]